MCISYLAQTDLFYCKYHSLKLFSITNIALCVVIVLCYRLSVVIVLFYRLSVVIVLC